MSMIGLIEVTKLYFFVYFMLGYNKQQFVKPYTVKFKILVNKYYRMWDSTITLYSFSWVFDAPNVLAIYWDK